MSETIIIGCLITLVILFLIYCISGTVVRYRRGVRSFPDVIPHCTFWVDTLYCILCCGKSRSSSYNERITQLPDFNNSGIGNNNSSSADNGDNNANADGMNNNFAFKFGGPYQSKRNRFSNIKNQQNSNSSTSHQQVNDEDDDEYEDDAFVHQQQQQQNKNIHARGMSEEMMSIARMNKDIHDGGNVVVVVPKASDLDRLDEENEIHHQNNQEGDEEEDFIVGSGTMSTIGGGH